MSFVGNVINLGKFKLLIAEFGEWSVTGIRHYEHISLRAAR